MKHTTATPTHPIAYLPSSLIDFLHFLTPTSTTLTTLIIICTSQSSFLHDLSASLRNYTQHSPNVDRHPLLERTLRLLASTSHIKLAFCPTPASLHAYLAALPLRSPNASSASPVGTSTRRGADPPAVLALLNVVRLHRTTAAYSAQGLSRAFAAAVEAAWEMRRRLVVFEYPEGVGGMGLGTEGVGRRASTDGDGDEAEAAEVSVGRGTRDSEVGAGMRTGRDMDDEEDGQGEAGENTTRATETRQLESVWTEQVPILDATTKTFGNFGDRGWMGRTVSVADVAARWCSFAEVPTRGRP